MSWLTYLLTGGFAKGYRTYILAGVAIVGAVANFALGDADLQTTVPLIVAAVGLLTAAKHQA